MKNNFIMLNSDGSLSIKDKEFIAYISRLNTPKKIGTYTQEDFVYSKKCEIKDYSLYKFWKSRRGTCVDFSYFGAFVATYHGYEAYQMEIAYEGISEKYLMTVYAEDGGMSFITGSEDSQDYFDNHGKFFNSFEEIKKFLSVIYPESEYPKVKEYVIIKYEVKIKEGGGD